MSIYVWCNISRVRVWEGAIRYWVNVRDRIREGASGGGAFEPSRPRDRKGKRKHSVKIDANPRVALKNAASLRKTSC